MLPRRRQLILWVNVTKGNFFLLCPRIKFFLMSDQRVNWSHAVVSKILLPYSVQCVLVDQSSSHLLLIHDMYSTFKLEEGMNCKPGVFGALVSCYLWVLLGLEMTTFPLMMPGNLETMFLLKHFLPVKQTLGKYLLSSFKVIEKCSLGSERAAII